MNDRWTGRFSLEGKIALVTGAGRGIGRATALALADVGADVVLVARTQADLDEVAAEVRQRGRSAYVEAVDVSDAGAVEAALERVTEKLRRIDVLVNNAGAVRYYGPFEEMRAEDWEDVERTNLRSTVLVSRAAAPALFASGRASVVNIGSIDGLHGVRNMAAYCAAKAGVIGLTKALAVEWAPRGVRVNCVCPGAIATEATALVRERPDSRLHTFLMTRTPQRRFADPYEVPGAIVYLASDAASFTTGAVLSVDGGFTAS